MYKLNFGDIKSDVKSKVHYSSLTDVKLERWANITQDYIWSNVDLKSAELSTSFSCVASTATYYIDANIGRIKGMVNTTQEWLMDEVSDRELDSIDPARTTTGSPTRYSLYGKSEVYAHPSSASKVTIVSSGADTTQYVRVIGKVSSVETAENKQLNGLVSATTTATFDANSIVGVRLSAVCVGNITVTAGAVTLVIIPIGKLFMMYQPVKLSPVPSGTDSIKVNYIQGPRPMISDYDIPDLPPEFHRLIIMGTLAQAHEEVYEFDRAEMLWLKLDKEIDLLRRKDSSIRGSARVVKSGGIRHSWRTGYGKYPTIATG